MNHTLKSIRLASIIIFYFYVCVSNLLAVDFFRHEYIIKNNIKTLEDITTKVQKCKKSKNNNFKDRSKTERTILIYLNTLLEKIVSTNESILEKFGRSSDEFCIDMDSIENGSFANSGLGLIFVDIDEIYSYLKHGRYIYESYIVAAISHELAHDLLNHILKEITSIGLHIYDNSFFKNNYIDINEYDFDKDLTNPRNEREFRRKFQYGGIFSLFSYFKRSKLKEELNEEFIEWNTFYTNHSDYIKFKQYGEIDADNLGLILYLNTGFNPKDYEKRYIANISFYNNPIYYYIFPDLYIKLSKDDTYLIEGEKAIKEGKFDEFMNSIKYARSTDHHPSDFWRYWNARIQREFFQKNNYNNINSNQMNGLYFKIDLSKLKRLNELKAFFPDQEKVNLSIIDKNDPRVYIIDKLLHFSKDISYTLEFFPNARNDIALIHDDDTMLLSAYNIFQILILQHNLLNTSHCKSIFGILEDNSYDMMYEVIQKAFIR